jgi:hypothetical protein
VIFTQLSWYECSIGLMRLRLDKENQFRAIKSWCDLGDMSLAVAIKRSSCDCGILAI